MIVIDGPAVSIVRPAKERDIFYKIAQASYTCYQTDASKKSYDDVVTFVKKLIERGHESPLEHASITMDIITDRGVTHELVRHRIGAYSQESTRYCNYSKGKFNSQITCMNPFATPFREKQPYDHEGFKAWMDICEKCEKTYNEMLANGIKPEDARGVLPMSLASEIVVTYNIRQWRHVIKQRLDSHAHPMMRYTMGVVLDELTMYYPNLFDDLLFEDVSTEDE